MPSTKTRSQGIRRVTWHQALQFLEEVLDEDQRQECKAGLRDANDVRIRTDEDILRVQRCRSRTASSFFTTSAKYVDGWVSMRKPDSDGSVGPRWASEGQLLYQSPDGRREAKVTALSPSPGTEALAMEELAGFLAMRNEPQRRAVALTPNQRSIALWVEAGNHSILLGGDLEESINPAIGWAAVVASTLRPQEGRASVFKVPHHGSENGDNPSVWTEMLTERPLALLAPYASGRKPLPSPADISRLTARTDRLYCTAPPKGWKPQRRDSMVEKTAREVTHHRRTISGTVGQVRVRLPLEDGTDSPSVHLFPPALELRA